MDYLKQNHLSILVLLFVVASMFLGGGKIPTLGAAANVTSIGNPWEFNRTVKIGTNGATMTELKATTCNLIGTNGSHTASTTVAYDCAVTGVASGDVVLAQLASSTPVGGGAFGWDIRGAIASTTAGYVTVLLYNGGPSVVPSATSVGSSTQIWYMDN